MTNWKNIASPLFLSACVCTCVYVCESDKGLISLIYLRCLQIDGKKKWQSVDVNGQSSQIKCRCPVNIDFTCDLRKAI